MLFIFYFGFISVENKSQNAWIKVFSFIFKLCTFALKLEDENKMKM